MSIEESPHKTMKLDLSPSPSWCPLLSVPDDVALDYMSLVSRSDHAALCVASKSYRSLVASPYLYKTRSLITETYVYVCILAPPPGPNPRWYMLRRRKTSSDLIPIPSLHSQAQEASSMVVVDWGIYVIGGLIKWKKRISDVFLLDCRTHKWRQVPSMRVARANAAAGVVDGKIYVLGGCKLDDNSHWGEVFDPKTQTWDSLPLMNRKELHGYIHDSFVSDQKVYALCGTVDGRDRTFYYSPREGKWGRIENCSSWLGDQRDWCMIGNLLYSISIDGTICWREPERMVSNNKEVEGLGSLEKSLSRSRLIHFDQQIVQQWEKDRKKYIRTSELMYLLPGARVGNMLLFWSVLEGDRLEISCAEISLERRGQGDDEEVWGNIEWSNVVMTVDPYLYDYKVLHSASVLV